jgi:hypothetical protein
VNASGGNVVVTVLEPHRFTVGMVVYLVGLVAKSGNTADPTKYNATYTDDGNAATWSGGFTVTAVTSLTFTFALAAGQSNGDILGAPGINDFNWLSGANMMELNNNSAPPNWKHLKAERILTKWRQAGDPEKVAVVRDYGTGVLLVRFSFVPAAVVFAVNLIYQKQAVQNVSLSATFSPVPDQYRAVIDQAVLYRMYRYLNSPTAQVEYEKLQAEILKAKGVDQSAESNVYLEPEEGLVDWGPNWVGY